MGWLIKGDPPKYPRPNGAIEPIRIATWPAAAGSNFATAETEAPYETAVPDLSESFGLQVSGDSMVPLVRDGQHVLVTEDEPDSGDLAYVELHDDTATVKRVVLEGKDDDPDQQWILQPVNPEFDATLTTRREVRRAYKVWAVVLEDD